MTVRRFFFLSLAWVCVVPAITGVVDGIIWFYGYPTVFVPWTFERAMFAASLIPVACFCMAGAA